MVSLPVDTDETKLGLSSVPTVPSTEASAPAKPRTVTPPVTEPVSVTETEAVPQTDSPVCANLDSESVPVVELAFT